MKFKLRNDAKNLTQQRQSMESLTQRKEPLRGKKPARKDLYPDPKPRDKFINRLKIEPKENQEEEKKGGISLFGESGEEQKDTRFRLFGNEEPVKEKSSPFSVFQGWKK